jgi:ribosomal peptide maturation radical SAM protein 1
METNDALAQPDCREEWWQRKWMNSGACLGPRHLKVALVSMPFASIVHPSLQLGLLNSVATASGFASNTFHLNLDFAKRVGAELYEVLCSHRGRMLGDWLFSVEAFEAAAPDHQDGFLEAFADDIRLIFPKTENAVDMLRKLRREDVPQYLDSLLSGIPWGDFDVVGFTSTFQQNAASFALATRIKRVFPNVIALFGGANFEGEMGIELVRSIKCIDCAIIGEADEAFPELLTGLQAGGNPADVLGVAFRRGREVCYRPREKPFDRIEELPYPHYDEYFSRAEALGLLPKVGRRGVPLPFESARGCWWGQKSHCTFCGLNGKTMQFRSKSPKRVVDELTFLATRYRSFRFDAVDNIMSASYISTLLHQFSEEATDYELFYEVKANLTRQQLKSFRQGGVRRMQPGIESLNTKVLKLMRKGITAAQNVNLLRWSLYYRLDVIWNLLWGFPGETREDYASQLTLLRQIIHLQPPWVAGRIWMERFSPIYDEKDKYPTIFVQPEASYRFVYPKECDLDQLAYFFDYKFKDTLDEDAYLPIGNQVRAWQEAWATSSKPSLTYRAATDFLQVDDTRYKDSTGVYTFTGPLVRIYIACSDQAQSPKYLRDKLNLKCAEEEIEAALMEFCARGLMMRDGNVFLSLALPATPDR